MLKAGAMLYKRVYLSGSLGAEIKPLFRKLQLEGEQELGRQDCSAISPLSAAILSRGVPKSWRQQRAENARALLALLEHWGVAMPTFRSWPEGHAPFDVALVFESQEQRDHYQRSLQREDIYCPVEWVCDTADLNAMDLSSRILNIPIDQRYGREEMERIAAAILAVKATRPRAVAV
jgi:dTDP-4-amino-4,6-dideoxygalactose transaminase